MQELDKVLNENEKVLWEGGPVFWPFFLGGSVVLTIFGMFWMIFVGFFIWGTFQAPGPFRYIVFLMPHFWIGLGMLFGPSIYNYLVFKHTFYAITDKRLIFQTGVIGRDFKIIDLDQISNAEVNVGVFDKLFDQNTGSILVSSPGTVSYSRNGAVSRPFMIRNVVDPYMVFKFLKKVEFDVRADVQFPNQLRPSENPGYGTNYNTQK